MYKMRRKSLYRQTYKWYVCNKTQMNTKRNISGKNQNVQDLVFYAYQKIQNDLFYIKWCTMYNFISYKK